MKLRIEPLEPHPHPLSARGEGSFDPCLGKRCRHFRTAIPHAAWLRLREMKPKQRVLAALFHEKPDRAPFNFWMDRRLMGQYEREIGHRHWRVTHYGADVIETFPQLNFPIGPAIERDGTCWITEPYFKSWDDVGSIPMPDPNIDRVYELIDADIREFPNHATFLDMVTPWGVIAGMRTYELTYTDMYDHSDEFKSLSRKILDVQKVVVERACQMGITALCIMEDLATSQGLSFSPKMIEEFCLVYAREMADIAHGYGIPVLFHSDGKIMDLIQPLLSLEILAVNPLQPHLNDALEFKRRFGGRVAVYGGLDNCYVIPNGTPNEVRTHVLDVFEKLGRADGSLILSTHDIPLGTPRENVEAVINTIKQDCLY